MAKIRYLHTPPGRDDLYFRRKIPGELRALFNCGDFYKVPLGTKDPRAAEPLLAIANGEYEKKVAIFRETLKNQPGGKLSDEEAHALVGRYLTGRSASGFAAGGTQAAFILLELDRAVDDLAGRSVPTAETMSAGEWSNYRQRLTGSDGDSELDADTLARIEADHAARHRPPGEAWFAFHGRVPRRRWRPLAGRLAPSEPSGRGASTPVSGDLAPRDALLSPTAAPPAPHRFAAGSPLKRERIR